MTFGGSLCGDLTHEFSEGAWALEGTRVVQERPSHKSGCPTRVFHKSMREPRLAFPTRVPTRLCHKTMPQECPTRVLQKSAPQERRESAPHEFPGGPYKSPTRAYATRSPHKSVRLFGRLFLNACVHLVGLVGLSVWEQHQYVVVAKAIRGISCHRQASSMTGHRRRLAQRLNGTTWFLFTTLNQRFLFTLAFSPAASSLSYLTPIQRALAKPGAYPNLRC
ncbi:unnamed protein product [Durusdinium trenchii]|uniref:Transmembrane protein n=1 Tax=Durusdinium trenchii TaxID=1381693 RepID=A0ABP0HL01_9DINO